MRVDVQLDEVLAFAVLPHFEDRPSAGRDDRRTLDGGCHRLEKLKCREYHGCPTPQPTACGRRRTTVRATPSRPCR